MLKKMGLLLSVLSFSVHAHDLGTWGNTWKPEKDIRMTIMENIADVNWEPVHNQLKDSATNFINAFVKINVHFSFYFSDLGNSSLPFSFTGILSST